MIETAIEGVVIQLAPSHRWAGTFWIVEKRHTWGVTAYTIIPGQAGVAYIKLAWEEFESVGQASWTIAPGPVEEEMHE